MNNFLVRLLELYFTMCKSNFNIIWLNILCIVFMTLPSQPLRFGARKNENNFSPVSEAYVHTLMLPGNQLYCQHRKIPYMTSQF